ncbi:MAG: S-methyl-5-thioribose-1-phosphate isomerase [Bacteroidales bacterium]|nr:S-methyl-5-thioribose-1-phosphate isomerase [Bacteroidales bacterium]
MNVNGKHYKTIWLEGSTVMMLDQNALPFEFKIFESRNYKETCLAIITMITRGAGAIGAAAGFAMAQAFLEAGKKQGMQVSDFGMRVEDWVFIDAARKEIEATRPTARNLFHATEIVYESGKESIQSAINKAQQLADDNIADAMKIGEFGNALIHDGSRIMTHCNAGWLGFVDYGSALAPIYIAHREGKKFHVYADETRPRSQGARLTAWELYNEGVSHTIVPDNAGAYLMSKGMIDFIIVGADRIAANGDTANKIGTFEKAIVAKEFGVPFYVAAPLSTFDMATANGSLIPIEQRSEDEVHYQEGPDSEGKIHKIRVSSPGSSALNPAFDVTPASFIKGIITERGIIPPTIEAIRKVMEG